MSNRLVTHREFVLLSFIVGSILLGSVVTVWMEMRDRSPVEKEPAEATAAPVEPQPAAEPSLRGKPAELPQPTVEPVPQPARAAEIAVEVAGSVRRPGVYRFTSGATVADAIARAGGLSDNGDTEPLNQAAPLLPATKLTVPGKPSVTNVDGRVALTIPDAVDIIPQYRAGWTGADVAAPGVAAGRVQQIVDINTASRNQLETLPDIGPKTAEAIIAFRRVRPFVRVEDIMEVRGIGPITFERLRPLITVRSLR